MAFIVGIEILLYGFAESPAAGAGDVRSAWQRHRARKAVRKPRPDVAALSCPATHKNLPRVSWLALALAAQLVVRREASRWHGGPPRIAMTQRARARPYWGNHMPDTLFSDAFFRSLQSSVRDVNESETLPPICYTDPGFFEFEKQAIFYREWLCVGREAWVRKPGDYFTTSHVGEPIVIVRNRDGVVKAMSSVCQHRAMLVAEGQGNTRSFRCPYHHWTYSLDGNLVAAPEMDRACEFDKTRFGLPELKVEVWQGFIFVNFDREAAPLAPRLTLATAVLDHYDLASADESSEVPEMRKEPWNWKVRIENSNDGYHANRLHGGPQHDCCPSELSSFPDLPDDFAAYFRYNKTTHLDYSTNPTLHAIFAIFPRLTIEERGRCLFLCVPPSLTMFARCDLITFNTFHADGPETMSSRRGSLVAAGAAQDPLFKEKMTTAIASSTPIVAQDRHVDALVQVGLRSKFAIRGRYCWQEQAQRDFNAWLVPRYLTEWEKTARRAAE
jgi:nitrite reductase/ring-hydroxylating ferredoxin subunit